MKSTAFAAMAVGALALTGVATQGASAAQAPSPVLKVTYDAHGSSTVAKTGSVVELGPTTLTTKVNPDGTFTGSLPLPSRDTSFKLLGFLPVKATVSFIPAGPVKGKLGVGTVTSKAFFFIRLSNVTVAGLPAFVGSSCQTAQRTVIPASTPPGEKFDLTLGGNLAGTYTIGQFANCGLTTALLNQLIPGPGNTQTLAVSNGRLG
ncbi:MAG: hypothetical protein ABI890_13930 [Lapillicoccus sp.]